MMKGITPKGITLKTSFLLLAVCILPVLPARAYEVNVKLQEYVTRAEAIAVCVPEKDNGDGTVTANITEVLKGTLNKSEVVRGETGYCVMQGPASRFMRPGSKYLVFLFKDNTVGRLGGILDVEEDKTLAIRYMDGFTGTTFHKEDHKYALPLSEAKTQIQGILQQAGK